MATAEEWITRLGLQAHPEGGFFAETWRSDMQVITPTDSAFSGAARAAGTAIHYLLTPGTFSRLHRLQAPEVWHHYDGCDLRISVIHPDGRGQEILLGKGQAATPQALVPPGTWFGARPIDPDGYVLAGCTMAPGFEFADFELGDRPKLLASYPQHTQMIKSLTPED